MYDVAVADAAMDDAATAAKWMEKSMDAREGPVFHAVKKRMDLDW